MSVEFLLACLVIVVSPGTGVIYTVQAGLSRGWRAGLIAALACTIGSLPHMAAAVFGLAAILHSSALAFQGLKYAGVSYLLYMAWRTLRDHSTFVVEPATTSRTVGQVVADGVLLNLLNPKLSIFFFAFLPQFVRENDPQALFHMLELSSVFVAMTLVVFAGYGLCAAAIRRQVTERPAILRWLRRSFASVFLLLGAKLAVADQ